MKPALYFRGPIWKYSINWYQRKIPEVRRSEVIIFCYSSGRDGRVAMKFLGDYHGYVQTDGYAGYNFLDLNEAIIHLACWAHARRKFVEVARL